MRKLELLSAEEIERQFQELGTSTAEMNERWKDYFDEAERFAKELGFKSLKDVPMHHDVHEAHMEKFSFNQKFKKNEI